MSRDGQLPAGHPGYRALGLVSNPFMHRLQMGAAALPVVLEVNAAVLRLLATIDEAASGEKAKPVWVEKSDAIPNQYYVKALASALAHLTGNDELDVMTGYVPLDNMRVGRVRSALASVAEHVTDRSFDRTLAAYAASVLREPDRDLEEYAPVAALPLEEIAVRFESDPVAATAEYFGENVDERDEETSIPELLLETGKRESGLERDPEEDDATAEGTDELAAASPEGAVAAESEGGPESEGPSPAEVVAAYVEAHARAHLSPVVARGIRAYVTHGRIAAGQELKITKAPRKTITALSKFATHRYRRVCLIYDRFDPWPRIDEELRLAIIAALSDLRWRMPSELVLALLLTAGQAPELEEQFAAALRVDWSLSQLPRLERTGDELLPDVVDGWLAAATLHGREPLRIGEDPGLAAMRDRAGGSLEGFVTMAAAAVEDAARRMTGRLDERAVAAGSDARPV